MSLYILISLFLFSLFVVILKTYHYLICFALSFLFQVDVYQVAHIFRQVIGMLFFILYIISAIDNKSKRKTYLFLFLSFFSHNIFGLIGAACEVVRFFFKKKIKCV
ncbi:hypothetical protein UA31_14090 [Photobacterium angustum]|nr:hypothetical protein UB36_14085 [Photobacterium damselae subsp. damselae]KJG44500.1 hypothetical protein UA31_14090 [Photobacterium angustum]